MRVTSISSMKMGAKTSRHPTPVLANRTDHRLDHHEQDPRATKSGPKIPPPHASLHRQGLRQRRERQPLGHGRIRHQQPGSNEPRSAPPEAHGATKTTKEQWEIAKEEWQEIEASLNLIASKWKRLRKQLIEVGFCGGGINRSAPQQQ